MMESYQKAKVPPPVPPKCKLTSVASSLYQKENVFENSYHRQTVPVTGDALIQTNGMRVKIQINAENPVSGNNCRTVLRSTSQSHGNALKININGNGIESHSQNMLLKSASCANCNNGINDYNVITNNNDILNTFNNNVRKLNSSNKYINTNGSTNSYFCNIPSGQSSPSDNLDSGTCSDVDTGTSPPPPPHFSLKKNPNQKNTPPPPAPPLTVHQRSGSLNSSGIGVDSEDEDNVSCDSITSSEFNGESEHALPIISAAILKCKNDNNVASATIAFQEPSQQHTKCHISSYEDHEYHFTDKLLLQQSNKVDDMRPHNDLENTDRYLSFHLNEKNFNEDETKQCLHDDDTFAGFKSLMEKSVPMATIHSAKGTVRGVKNRVRAGIATFLNNNAVKSWQEKEAGKVVVYTTTMGIIRETYHRCLKVRQILKTHLVKFEEKDVFMSRELQKEIRERMKSKEITVPQVFVEGLHIGDAETIDRLNESGELRTILKPYRSKDALNTCQVCGGYRLLPCNICNGSKKSVRRPNFTTELVPLKCMNCDEVGLIKCYAC